MGLLTLAKDIGLGIHHTNTMYKQGIETAKIKAANDLEIANRNITSNIDIANADRTSRELIASEDRKSRYQIAHEDRVQQYLGKRGLLGLAAGLTAGAIIGKSGSKGGGNNNNSNRPGFNGMSRGEAEEVWKSITKSKEATKIQKMMQDGASRSDLINYAKTLPEYQALLKDTSKPGIFADLRSKLGVGGDLSTVTATFLLLLMGVSVLGGAPAFI